MKTLNLFADGNEIRRFPTYAAAVKHAEKISEWSSDVQARYIVAAAPDGDYFPVFIGNETIELLHSGYAVAN